MFRRLPEKSGGSADRSAVLVTPSAASADSSGTPPDRSTEPADRSATAVDDPLKL